MVCAFVHVFTDLLNADTHFILKVTVGAKANHLMLPMYLNHLCVAEECGTICVSHIPRGVVRSKVCI